MRTRRDGAGFVLLILIAVLFAGAVVFTLTSLKQDPIEEAISGDRVINTLFVLEAEEKPLATYVLMYYPGTRKAAVFNVPGEVGRILRSIDRVDRIDRVYAPNRIGPYEQEIENLLGLELNFSCVFTTGALVRLVDLLEGVDIFIPGPVAVYDPANPVFFPSGLVRLDGDKARSWLSYQPPDEDEGEAASRRQRFFLGLIRRLGQRKDIFANPALAGIFHGLIKTGMDQQAQLRIFGDFAGIDMDRIPIQSVGGTRKEVSGQTLLIPYYDGSQIKEFVRYALTALTRQSEGAGDERVFTVEVLNGTGTTGLAGRTAELLRGFGYDVISIGNAARNDYESTQVIDRSGFREVGAAFAGVIRCGNISFEPPAYGEGAEMILQNPEYKADLTLIIGRDFDGRYVTGG
ncbi:MAG: LCP family protein [Spirochaetaceae bacterium]|jgi:anionic cell wall polymer biosynthesis LytR-Cps2A-Psr (LCP) family protein|nr:LCP family protein [Spirochaetaceae bacterium]